MAREKLVKLSDTEYKALLEAKELIKQYGISSLSTKAQQTIKNGALGCTIHLGLQLIIEHFSGK